ncbi:protein of unknown function [Pseudomonas mediterranea]
MISRWPECQSPTVCRSCLARCCWVISVHGLRSHATCVSLRQNRVILRVLTFRFLWELVLWFPVNFRSAELHELCESEVFSYDHFFATCVCSGPGCEPGGLCAYGEQHSLADTRAGA